jgi:Type II secretion system (T2SS), protein M subtype b
MSLDLRDVRTQLLTIVAVLLLLDLAAIGVLVSPFGRSRGARQQRFEQLRLEKIVKTRDASATQGMAEKIATAREQEAAFNRDHLTSRYSTMSEQLSSIAQDAGVKVSDVKYAEHAEKNAPQGYDSVRITMRVHGSYTQDMRFINAVERQKMLLLIDAVEFSGMQGDQLTVLVHLTTYLRSAA